MKFIFYIFFLFCNCSIFGQNLILNPSLEDYWSCPDNFDQLSKANYWYSPGNPPGQPFQPTPPNLSTVEYYNPCSATQGVNTPNAEFGFQVAKDGNSYGGFYPLFLNGSGQKEYVTATLGTPLKANNRYCFSYYVSLANIANYAVDRIGAYFTVDSMYINTPFLIVTPQIESPPGVFLSDTIDWMLISGEFIATGGEKYVTIGNFNSDANTNYIELYPGWPDPASYYYIDMLTLEDCEPIKPGPIKPLNYFKGEIKIPNVFTPNNEGTNDVFEIEELPINSHLAIYNRWGELVYKSVNYNNDWDGSNCSDGVYYYILDLPTGDSKKGTVTILR